MHCFTVACAYPLDDKEEFLLYTNDVANSLIILDDVVQDLKNVPKDYQSIPLRRQDMQKSRLRTRTSSGIDVGLDLPRGTRLHHGDAVVGQGHTMVIEQIPEMVCVIRPKPDTPAHFLVLAGHSIGNMHRPITVTDNNTMIFPLQSESEMETFGRMLDMIGHGLFDISFREMVFVPHTAADVSGHG